MTWQPTNPANPNNKTEVLTAGEVAAVHGNGPTPPANSNHEPHVMAKTPDKPVGESSKGGLPKGQRKKKGVGLLVPSLVVAMAGTAGGAWYTFSGTQAQTKYETAPVGYKDLRLVIRERGTLEAKDNHDVKCEVKAGSRGNAKIKWVVENGTLVNKGDLLVEIDDSFLQEQSRQKKIDRLKALSDKIAAEQDYPAKQIAIGLAKKQLEQWVNGDFPQQLHDLEGQIQNSESGVLQQEDRTAWAGRMVKKGYMTANQAEAEQANLTGNKLTLQKYQEQKKVLLEYTDPVKRQTLENAIKQAEFDEAKAKANLESTKAVFEQQDSLYADLQEQISQCKISAEYSGIAVYAVPEQAARGMGGNQSIIAQGESVAAGQKILSIPDLSHMLVKVRVHEAFISNLKTGLKVKVRVDALGNRELDGNLKYVASVPAPADWMSPDVRVYECTVEITDTLSAYKLKPGLSAVCSIATDLKADHALAVPIHCVVSPLEKGASSRVYVLTATGVQPKDVELGMSDGTLVEIKSGLNEGDLVVQNARTHFSDTGKKEAAPGKPAGPGAGKMPPGPGGPEGAAPGAPGGAGRGKGKGKGMAPPGGDM